LNNITNDNVIWFLVEMVDSMPENSAYDTGTNRRSVVKGFGIGVLTPAVLSGVGESKQSFGSLDVQVEPWDEDEGRAISSIDTDDDFEAKIDVSGLSSPTSVAYMVASLDPNGSFGDNERVHAQNREVTSNSTSIIHSSFNPSGFLHEWDEGNYRLFATVVDGPDRAFGVAVSNTFEIS
jgi:hypothetical protein